MAVVDGVSSVAAAVSDAFISAVLLLLLLLNSCGVSAGLDASRDETTVST